MIHAFHHSSKVEARWARVLDQWLKKRGNTFRDASDEEQWMGIDRVVLAPKQTTIEYKCDTRAKKTGNIFVETISNNVSGRKGWAKTCQADWLFYFITPGELLCFEGASFKRMVPTWERRYGTKKARNHTFDSVGLVVPIDAAKTIARLAVRL